jgi:hypothetical protein
MLDLCDFLLDGKIVFEAFSVDLVELFYDMFR